MSNELAMLSNTIPDHFKSAPVDSTTKSLMGGAGTLYTRRISIKGGVWRLMINGKEIAKNEERHMNVVIVAASPKVSRTFYAQQYQEGTEAAPPECWSSDGDFPDAKAGSPQSKRCLDCPQNVQGSGQGNSRACRYSQRLAVVLANDIQGDVFQLTLPAASIFGEGVAGKWPLQAYARMIGGKGIPITGVVTEMRFDTDNATPKINFKPVSFLSIEQHKAVISQGETEAAKRAITMTVAEADSIKSKLAPVVAMPVEASVVVKAESFEEPVKRGVSKKTEDAPSEKADLSKILAEWDD